MVKHIKKIEILQYIADILTPALKKEVENHILSCDICLFKVAHGYKQKHDSCIEVQSLFGKYDRNKLRKDKLNFVRSHMEICETCLIKYEQFIMEEESGILDKLVKRVKYVPLTEFKLPFDPVFQMNIMRSDGSFVERKSDEPEYKDIDIKMANVSSGDIQVLLKSKKYSVSKVSVSIGKHTTKGFKSIHSSVTSSKGIASFKKTTRFLSSKSKSSFSLYLSGLKKKK